MSRTYSNYECETYRVKQRAPCIRQYHRGRYQNDFLGFFSAGVLRYELRIRVEHRRSIHRIDDADNSGPQKMSCW